MLMKYCNRCGCNHIVPQGVMYCKVHTETQAERHKEYDQVRRNKKAKTFYNSPGWRTVRQIALIRDNYIDVYLYVTEGRVVPAQHVHHITELEENYSKRLDLDNLISLSAGSHSKISKMYKDAGQREEMQKTLRDCLREYKKRIGKGEPKKF